MYPIEQFLFVHGPDRKLNHSSFCYIYSFIKHIFFSRVRLQYVRTLLILNVAKQSKMNFDIIKVKATCFVLYHISSLKVLKEIRVDLVRLENKFLYHMTFVDK
jgi:hypothetical protein